MFYHVQNLINPIVDDEPDPSAANAWQEGLGGQFGEMRTMMQYLFQSFNFRGNAKPYLDLIQGIGTEEISHVELISKTIARLVDGAPGYNGKKFDVPGKGGDAPMEMAKEQKNPHHFIVGAQGALPVDVERQLCTLQRQSCFGSSGQSGFGIYGQAAKMPYLSDVPE